MRSARIRLHVTENTDAMLGYWDADQVCRYANNAYFQWFGKTPEEMINKISLAELLGESYSTFLPYIKKVFMGETQVFSREIITPAGETRRGLATLHPDIEHGIIKGFFVHVANMGNISEEPGAENAGKVLRAENISDNHIEISTPADKRMGEIASYLKTEIFSGFPGLSAIAKKYLVSVSKLKRDFKTAYNSTPLTFYRNLQMDYAVKRLKEKKVSKKALASLLNFSNPSNFSNYFKRFINDLGKQRQQAFIQQQSHQLNKIFIEQSPFAIAMFDNNMNYLAASQQWLTDYQLMHSDVYGRSHYDIFPNLPDEFKLIHNKCLNGSSDKCEAYCWTKPDGSMQWIKWDVRPWYSLGEVIGGLLIFTEDISEKKREEQASLRANYILNKSSDIAGIGTWERDLVTGKVTCNKAALDILEMEAPSQASLKENIGTYKSAASRKKIETAINNAINLGKSFDIELAMVTAKNNEKNIRVIGQCEFNNGTATTLFGLFMVIK